MYSKQCKLINLFIYSLVAFVINANLPTSLYVISSLIIDYKIQMWSFGTVYKVDLQIDTIINYMSDNNSSM